MTNLKPVMLKDSQAVRLIRLRAQRECRSAMNALKVTVLEALAGHAHEQDNLEGGGGQPGNFREQIRDKSSGVKDGA